MHTYTYTCKHTFTHTHTYNTHTYTHKHTFKHTTHTHTDVDICTHTQTHLHTHAHMYTVGLVFTAIIELQVCFEHPKFGRKPGNAVHFITQSETAVQYECSEVLTYF